MVYGINLLSSCTILIVRVAYLLRLKLIALLAFILLLFRIAVIAFTLVLVLITLIVYPSLSILTAILTNILRSILPRHRAFYCLRRSLRYTLLTALTALHIAYGAHCATHCLRRFCFILLTVLTALKALYMTVIRFIKNHVTYDFFYGEFAICITYCFQMRNKKRINQDFYFELLVA